METLARQLEAVEVCSCSQQCGGNEVSKILSKAKQISSNAKQIASDANRAASPAAPLAFSTRAGTPRAVHDFDSRVCIGCGLQKDTENWEFDAVCVVCRRDFGCDSCAWSSGNFCVGCCTFRCHDCGGIGSCSETNGGCGETYCLFCDFFVARCSCSDTEHTDDIIVLCVGCSTSNQDSDSGDARKRDSNNMYRRN